MSIKEDYNFYLKNKNKYNFDGKKIEDFVSITYAEDGKSAYECFNNFDSKGIRTHICSQPELLKEIIICKGSINLHIKMYAESIVEGTLFPFEVEEIYDEIGAPDWFLKSTRNQVDKLIKNGKSGI